MQFQPISFTCDCGTPPLRLKQVGLTPQHQILIVWWCNHCKRDTYVVKDLADCWRDCPSTRDCETVSPVATVTPHEDDADFLRRMGVRLPDGD